MTRFITAMSEEAGPDGQRAVLRALHWIVNACSVERPGTAIVVIEFCEVSALDPGFVEGAQLVRWADAQTAKLREVNESFTTDELRRLLSKRENWVATVPAAADPPEASFDFRARRAAIRWALMADYFMDVREVEISPAESPQERT